MGLIYSRNDSENLINGLQTNIDSSKDATQSLTSGSVHLVSVVNSGSLSGAAYTAGQGLFSDLILPTIKKVTTAFDDIESDLTTYTSANETISSESYLDEDQLQQKIKIKRVSLAACMTSIRVLSHVDPLPTAIIQRFRQMALELNDDIKEMTDKLTKLHQFSSQTSGLFSSSLSNLKIAMQGVVILENTYLQDDGSYILPEGFDSSWFESLKDMSPNEMKEKIAVDRAIARLDLSEEGKAYYRELMKEALSGVAPDAYGRVIREYTQHLFFDDEGNIIGIKATSLIAMLTGKIDVGQFEILKNGKYDPELTFKAYDELTEEKREQLKERLPQILYGAAQFLLGLGVLGVDGFATVMSGGTLATTGISELAAAAGLTLSSTGAAILVDGLGLWSLSGAGVELSFAQNYEDYSTKVESMGHPHGNAPGSNTAQNKQFRSICKKLKLNKEQQRQLHDEITGLGLSYQEILEIAEDIVSGK